MSELTHVGGSAPPADPRSPRLLDQLREAAQRHVDWCRRFILFHDQRHPREMAAGGTF